MFSQCQDFSLAHISILYIAGVNHQFKEKPQVQSLQWGN